MIGEGIDGPNKLNHDKEAVEAATQTVKETTRSVAGAIEGGVGDQMRPLNAWLIGLKKRPCMQSR